MTDQYGGQIQNVDGVVIAGDAYKNLHLYEAIASSSATLVSQSARIGGRYLYKFLTSSSLSSTVVPVPFFSLGASSSRGNTGSQSDYEGNVKSGGITQIKHNGTAWEISILRNDTSAFSIYVFTEAGSVNTSEQYGIQFFNASGECTFDSRARPLQINCYLNASHTNSARLNYPGNQLRYIRTRFKPIWGIDQWTRYFCLTTGDHIQVVKLPERCQVTQFSSIGA